MKVLILEDDSERVKAFRASLIGHELDITEYAEAAIALLIKNEYDFLFLDHDLGGCVYVPSGAGTGYEVAEWLSNNPSRKPTHIYLHSLNPVGRLNMKRVLPEAIEAPFAWKNIKR